MLKISFSFFIFALPCLLIAQREKNLTLVGRWPDGPCNAVFVKNDVAYVGNGTAVDILNISNLSSISHEGRTITQGFVNDVFITNEMAYIANDKAGISILNIHDRYEPIMLGQISTTGDAFSVYTSNNCAFVAADTAGLRIIDISNPENPQEIGFFKTAGYVINLFIWDTIACIPDPEIGLYFLDISDPSKPRQITLYTFENDFRPYDLQVNNGFAFVSGTVGYGYEGKLSILNIINQDSIFEVASISLPRDWSGWGRKILFEDNIIYIIYGSDVGDGLMSIDVTNPEQPTVLSKRWVWNANNFFVSDHNIYVTTASYGLKIFNIEDHKIGELKAEYQTGGITWDVHVRNNYAYVANLAGGLRVLDISDKKNPIEIKSSNDNYRYDLNCRSITISENNLFVSTWPGIKLLKIISGDSLQDISTFYSIYSNSIFEHQNYIFATDRFSGFKIIDFSNPKSPSETWNMDLGKECYDIFVKDSLAFLAAGGLGLYIFNITNPDDPIELNNIKTENAALGVFVSGDHAFLAERRDGMKIFNISNPRNPIEVSTYNPDGFIRRISVKDNFAYLLDAWFGLRIIDITDLSSPSEAGCYQTPDDPMNIFINDSYAYLSCGKAGLYIFDIKIVDDNVENSNTSKNINFYLKQNYPNPFNNLTTTPYFLKNDSRVELNVYSITGELIEKLVDKYQVAGEHKIVWDASEYNSGIFFIRLKVNNHYKVKKCIFIK